MVGFSGYSPGTIVVRTNERRLYYVVDGQHALRYPVGVGKAGKQWAGTSRIDVSPLPKGVYLKQVRYNGADSGLGQFVAMNPDVAAWLDITLSEGAAAISGNAAKEGKPVRDSMAVIAGGRSFPMRRLRIMNASQSTPPGRSSSAH